MLLLLSACDPVSSVGLAPDDGAGGSANAEDNAPELAGGTGGDVEFGCVPTASDVSVDEGEPVRITFACTGDSDAESWELVAAPGGSLDTRSGLYSWDTDLASAGTWTVTVRALAGEGSETESVMLEVVDAWNAPGNVEVDPLTYQTEYGLPVLHVDIPDNISAGNMTPTTVTFRGHEFAAEIQYRGAASSYYPKRSYRIDFPKEDQFEDKEQDFPKRRSIVLATTFDDNAYFRQVMCFDLWNAMNPGRQQIEGMFVVAYLDGAYWGLYEVTDHIDGDWWADFDHDKDGNLYKSVDHAANFYGTYNGNAKSTWHDGWEKKEGLDDQDFSDLDEFIEFVVTSSDSDFEGEIGERISLDDVYDWWSLVVFTEADDTGGKNAYLYRDPADPIWLHAPWDFNHSLGQTWRTEREPATYDWDFTSANGLFLRLLRSDTHGPDMSARFAAHRVGPLHPDELERMIDEYVALTERSARRDWDRWEDQYVSYSGWNYRDDWTSYDEEVAYVRQWLDERWAFVEAWDP